MIGIYEISTEEFAAAFIAKARKDPIHLSMPRSGVCECVRTADEVLSLQQSQAVFMMNGRASMNLPEDYPSNEDERRTSLMFSGVRIALASPHLWDSGVYWSVQGMDLPRHRVDLDDLMPPDKALWMVFDRPLASKEVGTFVSSVLLYSDRSRDPLGDSNGNVFWGAYRPIEKSEGKLHFELITVDNTSHRHFLTPVGIRLDGRVWPEEFEDFQIPFIGPVLKMLAFIRSPYVPKESMQASRPVRRRRAKQGFSPLRKVQFITLRKSADSPKGHDGSTEGADWKSRWIVSGHFRNQAYGEGRKLRRMIWIAPFVKGPADKPLVERRKVYKVAR